MGLYYRAITTNTPTCSVVFSTANSITVNQSSAAYPVTLSLDSTKTKLTADLTYFSGQDKRFIYIY